MDSLLRTVDHFFIVPSAIVWFDQNLLGGKSLCKVRTTTGEMFDVEAAECRRVLGLSQASALRRRSR